MITAPMLAGTIKDLNTIWYPVLVTPKLDGIRCLKVNGKAVSRNFKPIPNHYLRGWIEQNFPDGVDGELIMDGGSFQETTSAVMTEKGEPRDVVYHIFDYVMGDEPGVLNTPYYERMAALRNLIPDIPKTARVLLPTEITNEACLLAYETRILAEGYEGVMLRDPKGYYKCGRSTVREGWLLKLKRFSDAEAVVVGFEERMHNANVEKKDAFGHAEHSSHKAGMVPTGMLGALVVDRGDGLVFKIGTGFTEEQRKEIWANRHKYMSKSVKFKFQPTGIKEAPRFPVFLGWRHPDDMGEK